MNKRCKYFSEDLKENISDLEENIEKHEELNPILFEDNKIKSEIREKCLEIVDVFLEDFKENNIELEVKDIIITGSNASYNYTKDSDIDIHIVADTSNLEDPNKLYPLIYDAYKSLFNKRLEIKFYDIPVEVYVETQETPLVSNGVYSIKNDE
jgi:predicted nucleotidyltransferase